MKIESAEAVHQSFGDDQGAPVRSEDHAVGKSEAFGCEMGRAVGVYADQRCWTGGRAAMEIEAEVADPCAAFVIYEHVIDVAGSESGEIGVQREGAVIFQAQDSAIAHGGDEQTAVGKKAEARGTVWDGGDVIGEAVDG